MIRIGAVLCLCALAACAGAPTPQLPDEMPYVRGPIDTIARDGPVTRLLVRAGPGSREACGIHAAVDRATRYFVLEETGAARPGSLEMLAPGDTVEIHVTGAVAESCPAQGYAATVVLIGGGAR